MRPGIVLSVVLGLQATSAIFFVSDIVFSVFGIYASPINWQIREYLELGAALGLVLGLAMGTMLLYRSMRDQRRAEERLRLASGAFMDLLRERLEDWGLTPAEKDVALFAIKGLSTAEISALRGTSEGTIKAQTNAIYKKAGVNGRPQLLSLFIDDLMQDIVPAALAAPDQAASAASTEPPGQRPQICPKETPDVRDQDRA